MWIIPSTMKDLMFSPSVQESPDSILDYDSQLRMLAQSVTWRGKHTLVKSLRNASKRATWIPLLCGRIYEPSTASRGVERWIALSAGIRANRSPQRDSEKAKKIPAICGHGSPRLLPTFDRDGVSSRTSADIYLWGSQRCTKTLNEWGSALRRACSRRAKLAQVTDENDSSSWRTPTVEQSGIDPQKLVTKDGEKAESVDQRLYLNGVHRTISLEQQVNLWRTPTVHAADHQTPVQQRENSQLMLQDQVRNWPTPRLASGITSPLQDQMTSDRKTDSRLEDVVSMWPTPAARDFKGANSAEHLEVGTGRKHLGQLPNFVEHLWLSHLDQMPLPSGELSSEIIRTLNPRFVEWLMGLPPEWISCEHLATESFRQWLQEHS